jgi:catalase
MEKDKNLTNNAGAPVADNQNVMTAGPRGPMLLQDVWFLEKKERGREEDCCARKGDGAYRVGFFPSGMVQRACWPAVLFQSCR